MGFPPLTWYKPLQLLIFIGHEIGPIKEPVVCVRERKRAAYLSIYNFKPISEHGGERETKEGNANDGPSLRFSLNKRCALEIAIV